MEELLADGETEQDEDDIALRSASQPNKVAESRKRRVKRAPNHLDKVSGFIAPYASES